MTVTQVKGKKIRDKNNEITDTGDAIGFSLQ